MNHGIAPPDYTPFQDSGEGHSDNTYILFWIYGFTARYTNEAQDDIVFRLFSKDEPLGAQDIL